MITRPDIIRPLLGRRDLTALGEVPLRFGGLLAVYERLPVVALAAEIA